MITGKAKLSFVILAAAIVVPVIILMAVVLYYRPTIEYVRIGTMLAIGLFAVGIAVGIVVIRFVATCRRLRGNISGQLIGAGLGLLYMLTVASLLGYARFPLLAAVGALGGYALAYAGERPSHFILLGTTIAGILGALAASFSGQWAGTGMCLMAVVAAIFAREFLGREGKGGQ